MAVCSSAVTIYSMYFRLHLSTTPVLKFCKPYLCTVLDPITGTPRKVTFVELSTDLPKRSSRYRLLAIRITGVRINGILLYVTFPTITNNNGTARGFLVSTAVVQKTVRSIVDESDTTATAVRKLRSLSLYYQNSVSQTFLPPPPFGF